MHNSPKSPRIDVRVPTEEEILENPKRAKFIGGGWVDSSDPHTLNIYWHKRQRRFTLYSIMQVLEHETLHSVLTSKLDLETSIKLDNIHRCSCVKLTENKLVFVDEVRIKKWQLPPYVEEPTEDLLY
jgi:hypothetical protein